MNGRRFERAKRWLAGRYASAWIALVGATLCAPSLATGLAADDYLHALPLRHLPVPVPQRSAFDLFRFANGDPNLVRTMMERGQFLWTSDPSARVAFFRPLAAATHVLDYALWPNSPALMHLQNVAWYFAAILGAGMVLRRLLGATWVAGLATLLFAVDHTHMLTCTWIAARNGLMSLAFALPVLAFHDRWRRDAWTPGRWLAPLFLGIALASGESALGIMGYLAAYAVHLERGSVRSRALSIALFVPVLLLWRIAYALFDCGVSGSGVYLDPIRSPVAFLAALPARLPQLLCGELATPPSDFALLYPYVSPSAPLWGLAVAVTVVALIGAAMAPLLRRDPVARFFATGMVLAAVPICAGLVNDRLLLFVSLGAAGLLAQRTALPGGRWVSVATLFLLFIHLVLSPIQFAVLAAQTPYWESVDLTDNSVPRGPDVVTQTVILVNPPHEGFGSQLSSTREVRGEAEPAHLYELAAVATDLAVTRVDERSLRIRPGGGFFEHDAERFFRSADRPLHRGAEVRLSRMTVTVTDETPDGRPAEALFRFDAPLEDPSFVWMRWARRGYVEWEPPAIGETVHLRAFDVRRFVLDLLG
jgi:hypothetical protein